MRIASTLMCFDRPDYTRQVLRSFELAEESQDLDWFVFQDGAMNELTRIYYADPDDLSLVVDLVAETTLPIVELVTNEFNLSPAQQRYLIYRHIFDNCNYDAIFVFEDDMVIGKHYLKLLRIMAEQYPNHIGNMYTHPNTGGKRNLGIVKVWKGARLWGHYMTKSTWRKIKTDYTLYHESVKKVDYHRRRRPDFHWEPAKEVPWIMDDLVINRLCARYKVRKLKPHISRARYIGEEGMGAYKLPDYWKKKGMDRQENKITYKEDEHLTKFKTR